MASRLTKVLGLAVPMIATLSIPCESADTLSLRLGGFFPPSSDSSRSDGAGATGGLEFSHGLGTHTELGVRADVSGQSHAVAAAAGTWAPGAAVTGTLHV